MPALSGNRTCHFETTVIKGSSEAPATQTKEVKENAAPLKQWVVPTETVVRLNQVQEGDTALFIVHPIEGILFKVQ